MVHVYSTMIIGRQKGDDHFIQGFSNCRGNTHVQMSLVVLENSRLRRPERFFAVHAPFASPKGYHLNNAGEQSPREAIRSWKRHFCLLSGCAKMSMNGEGCMPKPPRKRQITRRKLRGTCKVV